jgi:flagellar motor switch protein FliM
VDLAPALALFLVERQLGGTDPLGATTRALSALEGAVILRDWMPRLGVAFAEAWGTVPPIPERLLAGAEAAALAPPEATMVVADLAIDVDGAASGLSLCYPAGALRALLDTYRPDAAPSTEPSAERARDLLVDVQAELGRVRIPIGDLLRLAVDDVIPLNRPADAPVALWVGNRLRCEARAGTRGAHLALQLLSPPLPPTTP